MLRKILGAAASIFLLKKLFGGKKSKSGNPKKTPNEVKGTYWAPLELEVIEKAFKPGEKGRNEGSNNSPLTNQQRICATEGELIHFVKSHYNKEIRKIRSWVIEGTNVDVQKVF